MPQHKGAIPWNKGIKMSKEHCAKLSKAHSGKQLSEETKEKIGLANKGKKKPPRTKEHCIKLSEAKKEEYRNGKVSPFKKIWEDNPDFLRGENNYNWKGGNSRGYKTGYYSKKYKDWRIAVFERDDYTCQECGLHGSNGYITAHHIKSFAYYPKLRFKLNNGLTLCEKCHSKTDNYRGRNRIKKITNAGRNK